MARNAHTAMRKDRGLRHAWSSTAHGRLQVGRCHQPDTIRSLAKLINGNGWHIKM
jgi:hypothetical protein